MNICAVSDETYDCWKDYVKGRLNVILNDKTTESFSFLIIFVIFVPIINQIKVYMNELLTQIQDVYAAFSTDAALQIEKNNKAAGTRARKASLELEKLMKEFRKLSLEESKK